MRSISNKCAEIMIPLFKSLIRPILEQAQRRAAAETVARKPIEHFIHDK